MLTEKDYCDKDLSTTLIKMGFRGFGFLFYDKDSSKLKATHQTLTVRTANALGHTLAISLYEAQKFLREEKDFIVLVDHILTEDGDWCYNITHLGRSAKVFKSYEDALSEGIKEAVKILKNGLDSKR